MSERGFSAQILFIFIALSLAVISAGALYFSFESGHLYKAKLNELESIADLKAASILDWRREMLRDGELIASLPPGLNPYARLLENPKDEYARRLVESFAAFQARIYEYRGFGLYPLGSTEPLFVTNGVMTDLAALANEDLQDLRVDRATLGPLFRSEQDGRAALTVRVPIRTRKSDGSLSVSGVLIAEIDPAAYLFPLIRTWPTASETGESLLVRRDGNEVIFLNELRFKSGTAMLMRFPIADNPKLPAAFAVLGKEGAMEGIDYRGRKVLAWVRPIRESDWRLVVKVDETEAFSPIRLMGAFVATLVVFLISVAGFCLFLLWRRRNAVLELRARRAEREKIAIAEQFEHLTRYANDSIVLMDDTLTIRQANDSACALYGYDRQSLIGKKIEELSEEPLPVYLAGASPKETAAKGYRYETSRIRADGNRVWVEVSTRAFPMNERLYIQEIVRDVSETKKARETILKSIAEKEVLIRELHHRTKNNMQVITSLLLLQAGETAEERVRTSYLEMVGRIRSMALVHEKLYQSDDLSNLELGTYIRELTLIIVEDIAGRPVDLRIDTPDRPIPVLLDIAIPCGLVLNELLSNALKHAFGAIIDPRLAVSLVSDGLDIELSVSDNGKGFPPGFDVREAGHMGWQTIIAIVESQLRGTVAVLSSDGTTVVVRFSTELYEERV